jgi:phage terminase small subunit
MALTNKQQVFVEAYLGDARWNATEAARIAGYAEPGQQGYRLLKNVQIAEAVKAAIAERAMSADEVLLRLAEHARGSMADFLDVAGEGLDLTKAEAAGKLHLVKKFTRTETLHGGSVGVELYDAQAALALLGKHHGLFTEKVEHSGPGGGPIPVREIVVKLPSSHESVDA